MARQLGARLSEHEKEISGLRDSYEPSLDELIKDPIVRLLMRCDHVTPQEVLVVCNAARARLQ